MCHKARYSWVVLAASFVAHYLLYGVTYGLGVFYVIIMETFQAGPTEVSLLCSVFTAVFFGSGRHTVTGFRANVNRTHNTQTKGQSKRGDDVEVD